MAFASGPASFQRFFVDGSLPGDVTDELMAALNARAFGRLATLPDDTQLGWIGPGHLFETEILPERIACGRFAHLAVRIDRLKAPTNVVKAYIRVEEETMRQTTGRDLLSRGELRQAREAALRRADEEARAGGFRRMNAYPVLLDLSQQTVYLGNLGPSVADKVMDLFQQTFGCGLKPADPECLAERIATAAHNARALESLTPFALATPPAGCGEAEMGSPDTSLNFLGKEFLSWLWYQIDSDDGPLQVRNGHTVTVMVDRTIRLQCDFKLTGTDVITADSPTSLPEARAALRVGKQPTRLGLILGTPVGEFRLTLDGPRWAVTGLSVPEEESEADPRAQLEQRFESIADAANVLDAMFELFILRRIDRGWDRDLQSMAAWATGKAAKPQRAASA